MMERVYLVQWESQGLRKGRWYRKEMRAQRVAMLLARRGAQQVRVSDTHLSTVPSARWRCLNDAWFWVRCRAGSV